MKKIISIALLLIVSIAINAQSTAKSVKFQGKDIYVLMLTDKNYTDVGYARLSSEQISEAKNLEERMSMFMKNEPTNNYDALFTRDGITARFLKYNEKEQTKNSTGKLPKSFKKETYFLSQPTKDYVVDESTKISATDLNLPFNKIADLYINRASSLTYDAMIVSKNKVEYITFK